jgi:hypothetical protein
MLRNQPHYNCRARAVVSAGLAEILRLGSAGKAVRGEDTSLNVIIAG